MPIRLVDFLPDHVDRIAPWFDDPDTQHHLGGRDWIQRAPSLLGLTVGDEFRGKHVTDRRMWLAIDETEEPVAFIDTEMYDRYAAWDGSDPGRPIISDIVELPSAGLALVVDPARRHHGFGVATIRSALEHPDLAHVGFFFASIETDNTASIACFERAGFRLRSPEPDFEGMLHYSRERSGG